MGGEWGIEVWNETVQRRAGEESSGPRGVAGPVAVAAAPVAEAVTKSHPSLLSLRTQQRCP